MGAAIAIVNRPFRRSRTGPVPKVARPSSLGRTAQGAATETPAAATPVVETDRAVADAAAARTLSWDEVGENVVNILELARSEAAALVGAAEAMALEVRADLRRERAASRADAEREALELRVRAEQWARNRLAEVDAELAEATMCIAAARAEAVRVEADAREAADQIVAEAADRARVHVDDQLLQARNELDRILRGRARDATSHPAGPGVE